MFRAEAIEHAHTHSSRGTVLLAQPLSHVSLTWMFAAIAAVLIAFLTFASVTRTADVTGVLLPAHGLIRVLCMQAGVVLERRVREGQRVRTGDVMFVLSGERASERDIDVERAVATLLQARRDSFARDQEHVREQTRQRAEATERQANGLQAELQRLAEQRTLQQHRISLADAALRRFTDLATGGYVAPAQVQDKHAELLEQQQRLAELDRARAATERELEAARATLRELPLLAARELQAGQRNIATLQQEVTENDARRRVLVLAPQDGTVTAITAEPGQPAALHQALASLLPLGAELEAELYAPSRAAGFIEPGMPVRLRYQAYPFQKFGQASGRVREVSATAMRADDLSMAKLPTPEPVYRVRVALERQTIAAYGEPRPLASGASVDATVVLERRRLHEWALEPLYTLTGRR